jgi:phosphoribosylamine--glycine ligase
MLTAEGPKVVEFNCRFGDPECQVLMPLIRSDFVEMLLAVCERRLASYRLEIENRHAACVVIASGGYPDAYEKGKPISGLDRPPDSPTVVFHAGTARSGDRIVTGGGRVLAVTSTGTTLQESLERCYRTVRSTYFDGAHYRTDIGHRALRRNNP